MQISVLIATSRGRDSLLRTLVRVAESIETAEAEGHEVQTVIIDANRSDEVRTLLADVEGAVVIDVSRQDASDPLLWRHADVSGSDVVWLGSDQSVPESHDIIEMATQFGRSPTADIVYPENGVMTHCAVRSTVFPELVARAVSSPQISTANLHTLVDHLKCLRARPERRRLPALGVGAARISVPHPDCFSVGVHTYFDQGTVVMTWSAAETITVGSYCSGSSEVRLLHPGQPGSEYTWRDGRVSRPEIRGAHRSHGATNFPLGVLMPDAPFDDLPQDRSVLSRPQVIGNDVWLGFGATVLGPVTVGHGSIIGAGAVVSSDVPPYSVVAGNPATVVRMRFSPKVIERLLRIAWWDWAEDEVFGNYQWFNRPIKEFVERFDGQATK